MHWKVVHERDGGVCAGVGEYCWVGVWNDFWWYVVGDLNPVFNFHCNSNTN